MSRKVTLPSLGESDEGGRVLAVLVAAGDHVDAEDPIVEVESDKATVEVPAPAAGVVREVLVAEGDEVHSGQELLVLDDGEGGDEAADAEGEAGGEDDGEDAAAEHPDAENAATEQEREEPAAEQSADSDDAQDRVEPKRRKSGAASRRRTASDAQEPAGPAPTRPSAAPQVRRFARELGVDLGRVAAADPDRLTEEDVKSHVRDALQRARSDAGDDAEPALPDFAQWGNVEREPMGNVRKATAATVAKAWRHVPQVTHFDVARIDGVAAFRARREEVGEPVSLTAILVKVCAIALQRFPAFNSSVDPRASELVLKHFVNVGVAVDTPRGLLVPVVRNVQDKGLTTLGAELRTLLNAARDNRASRDDLSGGTFTISNVGPLGGSHFTPLVVWPQVAILGIGRATPRLVAEADELTEVTELPLSLSYDHRAVDGADAARFTRFVAEALENPLSLLLT